MPRVAVHDPDRTSRIVGWTIIYGLNIILPAWFGAMVCKAGGLVGMVGGIFAFYAVVTFFVLQFPRFGTAVIRGGIFVAFSQFLVWFHAWAGMLAIGVWNAVCGGSARDLGNGNVALAEVGGFACTIMTGQPLFAVAVGLGYIIHGIGSALTRDANGTPSPDDE